MGHLLPRRALAIITTACLLTGLAFVAGPTVSTLARGPVKTIAKEVHASVAAGRTTEVALPIAASHVVIHWQGNPHALVSVAFRAADGTFGESEPVPLDDDGPDTGSGPAASDETFGQVLVADGATAVRVSSDRPIAQLTVVALDTLGTPLQQAAAAAAAVSGIGVADAAVAEPAIISRAGWGANEGYRFDSGGHEKFPQSFYPLQTLIVHHTAGKNNDPNPAATIRAIYYDHAILRDWGDIGYNFLIDAQGRVYEGQYSREYAKGEAITGEDLAGNPVRGAHAKDFNGGTVGIALLGNFQTVQPPAAQRTALVKLLAWEASRHGLNPLGAATYVNPELGNSKHLYNISGHRNVAATACPGNTFYPTFPALRQQVADEIAADTGPSVDTDPPTASLAPLLSPTGGQTMTFGLTFDEPVTDLTTDDLAVSGSSDGWSVTGLSGVGAGYTVTLHSDAPTDGTVVLTLADGSVTDLSGNAGPVDPVEATADFATDTDPPSVGIYLTPHRAVVNKAALDATLTFSEPVVGMSLDKVQLGGTSNDATPWSFSLPEIIGSGASYSLGVEASNPADGTLTLTIPDGAVMDAAGNPNTASSVSVVIDRTAPTTSTPRTSLRTGVTFSSSLAAQVRWSGSDGSGAGITTYDVERSVDGASFKLYATGLASPVLNVSIGSGHTYRFAVRAHDAAGNVGSWKAGGTTSRVVRQDTSGYVHYGSYWHSATSTHYSGGSVHDATAAGAHLSYTFRGRAIAFVTTLGPTRGKVKLYIDGAYITTLDLYRASTAFRQVIWSRSWSGSASHTIKLVVVGTAGRPRVDLDAFLVLR
jgi:hypothetical protein